MNIYYSKEEILSAIELLVDYYGIDHSAIETLLNKSPMNGGNTLIELDAADSFNSIYNKLGVSEYDELTRKTLLLLVHCLMLDAKLVGSSPKEHYRDMLKLFLLCASTKEGDALIIKNRTRSFHLENNTNWIVNEIIKPELLRLGLNKDLTPEAAQHELMSLENHKRGRKYKDPRVPIILWGTFRLISVRHSFRTPMPNVLCNFLIRFMQILGVFPYNTEIDALWIRAQLRYISSRKGGSSQA